MVGTCSLLHSLGVFYGRIFVAAKLDRHLSVCQSQFAGDGGLGANIPFRGHKCGGAIPQTMAKV